MSDDTRDRIKDKLAEVIDLDQVRERERLLRAWQDAAEKIAAVLATVSDRPRAECLYLAHRAIGAAREPAPWSPDERAKAIALEAHHDSRN